MQRCNNCIISADYPGVTLNNDGICNYCASLRPVSFKPNVEKFEKIVQELKTSNNDYDCLIGYTGGSDSTYMLYLLREKYDLRILALTADFGLNSQEMNEQADRICHSLGVDRLVMKLNWMDWKKIFQTTLKKTGLHSGTMCFACVQYKFSFLNKIKSSFNLPVIYNSTPNQYKKVRQFFFQPEQKLKHQGVSLNKTLCEEIFGSQASYFQRRIMNVIDYVQDKPILPFMYLGYDVKKKNNVLKEIGWKRPKHCTPTAGDCLGTYFNAYLFIKRYGLEEYAAKISELIRNGDADRDECLDFIHRDFDMEIIEQFMEKLGVGWEDYKENLKDLDLGPCLCSIIDDKYIR